jgi:hypothetical protein
MAPDATTATVRVLDTAQRVLGPLRHRKRQLRALIQRAGLVLPALPRGSEERRVLRTQRDAWKAELELTRARLAAVRRVRDAAAALEAERSYRRSVAGADAAAGKDVRRCDDVSQPTTS